jgi:predicted dienelactone hydrolase
MLMILLFACSPAQDTAPGSDSAASTTPPALPLSEPGPYFTGNREYTFVDESRDGREIKVTLWYPALQQTDANGQPVQLNAPPDLSKAPYPLILTESSSGSFLFKSHLASHGFVTARIQIPDHKEYFNWDINMVNWPRDFVFVLDQLASVPLEGLENVIDTERVGATGYSYGGDISLTLGGARIDPEFYLKYCKKPPRIKTECCDFEWYAEYSCGLAERWEQFTELVGEKITVSEDGLLQPVTDERIRAVMPMAASGAWLYGKRGLEAVDRPVLMVAATEDEYIPYQDETAFIYENLGASEKSLISFIGEDHGMVEESDPVAKMKHFATAFFGNHLQGRKDYAEYLTQDFVSQFNDLSWGINSGD